MKITNNVSWFFVKTDTDCKTLWYNQIMEKKNIIQLDSGSEYKMMCQGNTAEVLLFDETKILKLFRKNFPLEIIETEYNIAKKISSELEFVPKVFEIIEYKNRYGILYEKMNGKDMIVEMFRKPYKIGDYSKALAAVHVKIHKIVTDLGLDVKDRLLQNIDATTDLSSQEKESIAVYLKTLSDGKSLCHFNFHPGNVMIKGNEFYVIDWMTACKGDAISDVARTYLLLRYGELAYANFFVKFIAHIVTKHIGKVYLCEYKKLTGISDEDIKKWLLPIASARLIEWIPKSEKRKLLKFIRKELKKIN